MDLLPKIKFPTYVVLVAAGASCRINLFALHKDMLCAHTVNEIRTKPMGRLLAPDVCKTYGAPIVLNLQKGLHIIMSLGVHT